MPDHVEVLTSERSHSRRVEPDRSLRLRIARLRCSDLRSAANYRSLAASLRAGRRSAAPRRPGPSFRLISGSMTIAPPAT